MSRLEDLFHRWRSLRAFSPYGYDQLRATRLMVKSRRGFETTGYAMRTKPTLDAPYAWLIVVRVGLDVADAHATLLHEMTHVVAGWKRRNLHGRAWREMMIQATQEATGVMFNCSVEACLYDFGKAMRECFVRQRRRARAETKHVLVESRL